MINIPVMCANLTSQIALNSQNEEYERKRKQYYERKRKQYDKDEEEDE